VKESKKWWINAFGLISFEKKKRLSRQEYNLLNCHLMDMNDVLCVRYHMDLVSIRVSGWLIKSLLTRERNYSEKMQI